MIVVGAGRIGLALQELAQKSGLECTLIGRGDDRSILDGPQGDPILLAVRNDDLVPLIATIPEHRRGDLVFLQNGMFRDLLKAKGLSRATRGLLYFAVPSRGAAAIPGGISRFCGPHGAETARWFGGLGLKSESVDWARFSYYEFEKMAWLSVFGLICQVHGLTVGEAAARRDDVTELAQDMLEIGRVAFGVGVPLDYLVDRLIDYSASIPSFRAGVKEWDYRDGWLIAQADRRRLEAPTYRDLLRRAGRLGPGDGPAE